MKQDAGFILGGSSTFPRSTYPEILIFCVSKMALEVSLPDSGISTFWITFFLTCVILNYTGKQLVASDPKAATVAVVVTGVTTGSLMGSSCSPVKSKKFMSVYRIKGIVMSPCPISEMFMSHIITFSHVLDYASTSLTPPTKKKALCRCMGPFI